MHLPSSVPLSRHLSIADNYAHLETDEDQRMGGRQRSYEMVYNE